MNIIDRPTRGITGLEKHEHLPGRKNISRIIKAEMLKVVCFIGKVAHEKYTGSEEVFFWLAGKYGRIKSLRHAFPFALRSHC